MRLHTDKRAWLAMGLLYGALFLVCSVMLDWSNALVKAAHAKPDTVTCLSSYWCTSDSQNSSGANILEGVAAKYYTDVWAVGEYNASSSGGNLLIEHWNGSSWSTSSVTDPGVYNNLASVVYTTSNNVWAAGYYYPSGGIQSALLMHYNGSSWGQVTLPSTTNLRTLAGVAATGNEVWAVGTESNNLPLIVHCTGTSCGVVQSTPVYTGAQVTHLYGVTAVTTNDVWAVGTYDTSYQGYSPHPFTLHYNGTSWQVVPAYIPYFASRLLSVDYFTYNNVWAVGYQDVGTDHSVVLIEHWDGNSWSNVSGYNPGSNYNYLNNVFVTPAGDVWAVGNYGTVYAGDGMRAKFALQSSNGDVRSPANILPHTSPLVLHWNGRAWDQIQVPSLGTPANGALNEFLGVASSLTSTWGVGDYQISSTATQQTLIENYAAPTPPQYTTSRYESQIDPTTHYNQGYCTAARGESGIIVLDYGQPMTYSNGIALRYGTTLFDANATVAPTDAISQAVKSYVDGYADAYHHYVGGPSYCLPNVATSTQMLILALGVNNTDSNGHTAALNAAHATAWANVVRDVQGYVNTRNYTMVREIDAAIDAEPGFEPTPTAGTPTGAERWTTAYNNQNASKFFNYGSTDGYPCIPTHTIPNPSNCSGWSPQIEGPERIYTMSWGMPRAFALPEDYYFEWNRHWYLVKRWAKDQHSHDMVFSGAMSNCLPADQPCYVDKKRTIIGQSLVPAWQSFWLEINADPFTQTIGASTYITYTVLP